jgi:hypothetical protein
MATKSDVPKFDDLMVPTVEALKRLGGSASNDELLDEVANELKLSEAVRNVTPVTDYQINEDFFRSI